MADVNRGNRPLSPHLQVYKLPLMAVTSILSRAAAHALVAGALMLVWWLLAAATSPACFAAADWFVTSWLGILIWIGMIWALWFHFMVGVRHLYFDTGRGLERETMHKIAQITIAGSVVLTVLTLLAFLIF